MILFFPFGLLKGQNNTDTPESRAYKHSAGLKLSNLSGLGLSYQYKPAKTGLQVTILVIDENAIETYGVEILFIYQLFSEKKSGLYLFSGGNFSYIPNQPSYYYNFTKDKFIEYCTGLGMEMNITQHITFILSGGIEGINQFFN